MTLQPGAISFRNVTKTYPILQRATPRAGLWAFSKALEYFRREPFDALRDVSFEIQPGEMVGFLGSNGAGKSTALKLIAGITAPTSGHVESNGSISSLLELGVGFHPDLTGMENIFYNGIMMGMTRQQVLARLDEIIAFSGLSEFLYEPVKHYSSGMYSRLACSVALHLEPRIILVDEILAVGDAEFQQRGILKILELHKKGVTVILVTHETNTARDICDRLIWLDQGKIRADGAPGEIHAEYMRFMMARVPRRGNFGRAVDPGENTARLGTIRFLVDGREADHIVTTESASVELAITGAVKGTVRLGILWKWSDGRTLSEDVSPPIAPGMGNGEGNATIVTYEIPRWPMLRASISASVVLLDEAGERVIDRRVDALSIRVETPGSYFDNIIVSPLVDWKLQKM